MGKAVTWMHQHPHRYWFMSYLLLIQFSADNCNREWKMAQVLSPQRESQKKLQVPGFCLMQPQPKHPLGDEPADGKSFLTLPLCKYDFKINK